METQPLAVLPPSGWSKKTIVIRFNDDVTGNKATGNVRVFLNETINNVVYIEWVAVSGAFVNTTGGRIVNIAELNNSGDTTKSLTGTQNLAFWRVINTNTNYSYEPLPNALMRPFSLNQLTISVKSIAGGNVDLTGHWMVLDVWTNTPEVKKLRNQ